jgi:hypothetical protein
VIDTLLESLPETFRDTRNLENALGPALTAAYRVMVHIGGKVRSDSRVVAVMGMGCLSHAERWCSAGGGGMGCFLVVLSGVAMAHGGFCVVGGVRCACSVQTCRRWATGASSTARTPGPSAPRGEGGGGHLGHA